MRAQVYIHRRATSEPGGQLRVCFCYGTGGADDGAAGDDVRWQDLERKLEGEPVGDQELDTLGRGPERDVVEGGQRRAGGVLVEVGLELAAVGVEETRYDGEEDEEDVERDIPRRDGEGEGGPDAGVLPEGLGPGLVGHGEVLDRVGGEDQVGGPLVADGGQGGGEGRVDGADVRIHGDDYRGDGGEYFEELGAGPREGHAEEDLHLGPGGAEALGVAGAVFLGEVFGAGPGGGHGDAGEGVEDDGAGVGGVGEGVLGGGGDGFGDGGEGGEVDFYIAVEGEEGVGGCEVDVCLAMLGVGEQEDALGG